MVEIRPSTDGDLRLIEDLYPAAFPDEDLLPLVRTLFDCADCQHFVACDGTALTGHIVFTHCGVAEHRGAAALLGPLAVAPAYQGQGIGTALIRYGLDHIAATGLSRVLVLGDPAYYGQFGFTADTRITTPCPIPVEWAGAWQSLQLLPEIASLHGKLRVPEPWLDPALWAP